MIPVGILTAAATSSFSYLLNQYPGASAAYSLRKLRSAYTGNCIRVRRQSDNAETNIGFVANVLDTTTLQTFVGASNGYVSIWYDQSGNANNLVQPTLGTQPQIVNAGVITYRNGKPYIVVGTVANFNFTNIITTLVGESFSFWMTYEKAAVGNVATLARPGNSYHWLDYTTAQYITGTDNTITITALAANSLGLINIITNYSVGATMYRNSASIGTRGPLTGGSSSSILMFGTHTLITINEFVFYPSTKTSDKTGIDNNINSFYTIY